MLRNPKTALFIFILAILCFAGFSYYNAQAAIFKKPATDITYADLGKLKGKVHVTMDVDKCLGYYMSSKQRSDLPDRSRYYLVLHYDQKIKKYDKAIGIKVDSQDFERWDKLVEDTKNDNEKAEHIKVDGYITGMDVDHGKIFIESLGKTGLSVNLYSGKYIVLKNSKELNTKRFTLLFVGILLIVVGVAYLLLVYHPFNRE